MTRHEPGERDPDSPFDGVVRAEAANSLRKALSAQERGALAILFVADVHNHEDGDFAGAGANYWQERRFPPSSNWCGSTGTEQWSARFTRVGDTQIPAFLLTADGWH